MANGKPAFNLFWFALGLAAGVLLVRKRVDSPPRLTQLRDWEGALAERYGAQRAALLVARVQARFIELFAIRPRFRHPVLRLHLERSILPGVALYQVLKETLHDSPAALADLDACFTAALPHSPLGRQARMIDCLPGGFEALRAANRALLRKAFPPQGWQIEWVEDSPARIAYTISACFYHNVLHTYGVPELTAHFCVLDDQLYCNLQTAAFERGQTIGHGDEFCDFAFRPRAPQQAFVLEDVEDA